MRVALISDIHGNLAALDATLEALQGESIDMVVCLGDVAATGPEPCAVLDRLRGLACPTVMGNADAELLAAPRDPGNLDEDSRKIADISAWAAAQFDDDDRTFLCAFQPTLTIDLGSAGLLLCCHGSPRSYDDVIRASTPDEELDFLLANTDAQIIAGGHTHTRMLRHWRSHEVINPGSVGLAYDHRPDGTVRVPPWAEFAILSADAHAVSIAFRRVPYDITATVRAMTENGMPHAEWWAADWVMGDG
jgi:putative phosphoesterase